MYEALILADNSFEFTGIITLIIFSVATRQKYELKLAERKGLKKRGLTHRDLDNIEFVKNWEVVQKDGFSKFCFVQGGLTIGLILFPLMLLAFLYLVFFSSRSNIFKDFVYPFAAGCLLLPYLAGIIIYGLRYQVNQRRFQRLTDPLKLNKHKSAPIF